ncbi:MAG: hypothetical protein CL623_00400 [Arcobacter sp.]|nr:hypothetical protein [Arcobacter sp.]|tara:strand:+ start:22811 stop:24010 length:1200 start_codon:yes stop_codon:yes gene_type:complete
MKEIDVIFFVEHKDRELESIELVKSKLTKEGISSIIVSTFFHLLHLFLYKPKVIIFPYLLSKKVWPVDFVYEIYGDDVYYINMNWEQLLSSASQEYKKPQDEFVKNQVIQLSWDKHFKNNFLLKYEVERKNIHISGNIANEILHNLIDKKNEWRNNLAIEFNLDTSKKWLFMPMNYGWAFSTDELIKGRISSGYDEKIAWEYKKYSQKCLKEFILFIENLSENYNYEIIIRPHPSITEEQYKNEFEKEINSIPQNITLNKSYSIREWIIASDIVGSSWSTSVWDAHNIGKPVFLFTPYPRPVWLDVWWNKEVNNIEQFDSYEEPKLNNETKLELDASDTLVKIITNYITRKEYSIKFRISNKKLFLLSIIRLVSCKYFKCKLFSKYTKPVQYDYFDIKV